MKSVLPEGILYRDKEVCLGRGFGVVSDLFIFLLYPLNSPANGAKSLADKFGFHELGDALNNVEVFRFYERILSSNCLLLLLINLVVLIENVEVCKAVSLSCIEFFVYFVIGVHRHNIGKQIVVDGGTYLVCHPYAVVHGIAHNRGGIFVVVEQSILIA